MRQAAWGVLLGLTVSAGALLVVGWLVARRPPGVAARIRPHVLGVETTEQSVTVWSALIALALPHRFSAPTGGGLRDRLHRAGYADSPAHYRLEAVAWSAMGGCGGALVAAVTSAPLPWGLAVLAAVGAVAGAIGHGRNLARQARSRRRRIEEELPIAIELLAFAISSGEAPHGAIARVTRSMGGDLASEFAEVVAQMRSGVSLEFGLRAMADRNASTTLSRFVDSVLIAIERGTPLSDVMRAQAADARSESRRRLMEVAGRKDVAMLVPVVFLILPTVVVVALFPGIQSLRLVAP